MWILIIGLIVLTAIAMAVGYARNKKIQKKIESGELQAAPAVSYTHLTLPTTPYV